MLVENPPALALNLWTLPKKWPVSSQSLKPFEMQIQPGSSRVDVARAALDAGANMINDVSGLRNPEMEALVLERGCAVCIMHMQGEPGNMQQNPNYDDVFSEVYYSLTSIADQLV